MTHCLRKPATRPAGARSTASMLLSLVNSLDNPRGPLGRSATAIAHRLVDGACQRADHDTAAALLCQLLDACDADMSGYDDDGILSSEWDA